MSSTKNAPKDKNSIAEFHAKFLEIKNRGFLPSLRTHDTGIGKTFEEHMGIKENNSPLADFGKWEIKTKRALSESMLTLFTLSAQPRGVNKIIREQYGYYDEGITHLKCFRGTLYSSAEQNIRSTKGKVVVNRQTSCVDLVLNNNVAGTWDFKTLQSKVESKIKNTIFVRAESKFVGEDEHFHFTGYQLYQFKGFEDFLKAIESDCVAIDMRLGLYSSGPKKGKAHDHGTAFRIALQNLESIFNIYSE